MLTYQQQFAIKCGELQTELYICRFELVLCLPAYSIHYTWCSSRIKGCPQANYTWSQISRMRRSLEQIKQFEVNSRTKSNNSYNSKKITKCQTQFKRDG